MGGFVALRSSVVVFASLGCGAYGNCAPGTPDDRLAAEANTGVGFAPDRRAWAAAAITGLELTPNVQWGCFGIVAAMGLSDLDRYRFDVAGFVLFDDVLDAREVHSLRKAITDHGIGLPGTTVMEQRFGWESGFLGWHQAFRDLIDHPRVLECLVDLIGPYVRLDHAYGIAMLTGTSGLGLHGPAPGFDAAQYYVHRGGRMWSGLLSFSWALTDAAPGDGGFGCIPGSHRAEEPVPAGAEDLVVEVAQRAGSLLVFTEALVHCTIPWNGQEDRLALLYKYSPGNSSWAGYPAAPPEVHPLLTSRQRQLVQPPYVGEREPFTG